MSGSRILYRNQAELLGFFDGDCTVESNTLFAEVAEVTVVGGNGELACGNTVALEELADAFCTVLAESHVDAFGTGVVISPTGEDVLLVAVGLHHVSDSLDNALVLAAKTRNTDGIVNGSEGSRRCFNGLDGTAEAVLDLSFEVGDAGIGGSKTCAECVAVLGLGANGNDGSVPFAVLEVVGNADECFESAVLLVPAFATVILEAVETGEAEVERKGNLLAYVERVDKTGTESNEVAACVLVAV